MANDNDDFVPIKEAAHTLCQHKISISEKAARERVRYHCHKNNLVSHRQGKRWQVSKSSVQAFFGINELTK